MKKFVSIWGNWDSEGLHSYKPSSLEHDETSFNANTGYEEEDITRLNELDPGEIWKDGYGNHYIIRIQ